MNILKQIQQLGYKDTYDTFLNSSIATRDFFAMFKYKRSKINSLELPNSEGFTDFINHNSSDELAVNLMNGIAYITKSSSWVINAKNYKEYSIVKYSLDHYILPDSLINLQRLEFLDWEDRMRKNADNRYIPTLEVIRNGEPSREFPYFISIYGNDDVAYGRSFSSTRDCAIVLILLSYSRLVPCDIYKFIKELEFEPI